MKTNGFKRGFLCAAALCAVVVVCMGQSIIRRLGDLWDVRVASSPTDGHVLTYSSSAGRWTNAAAAGSSGITNGANALFASITVTNAQTNLNVTASRAAVFDADKRLTNSTVTATELGYSSGVTSALQTQLDGKQPLDSDLTGWATISTNYLLSTAGGTLTNNITLYTAEANPTNVVNLSLASATNVLNAAVTFLHATNGVTGYDKTHVRWIWAGGADRALTIPTAWKTNVNSAVPANITNGTITKMYVTSIGDTGSSANQSNVFVSFEFYK